MCDVHRAVTATTLFSYRDPLVRELVWALKFRARTHALHPVAAHFNLLSATLPENALLIPVPLSPERLRERGFNQSELIAEAIVSATQRGRVCADLLTKIRTTRDQAHLRKDERDGNIRGVFALARALPQVDVPYIIVDDVMTTGATLAEAVRVLGEAGARDVRCVAVVG